ncbi:MAG: hypothetical protein KDD25_01980 [Bdellovibrionales bacterium]|nr:hypothetical protein [Bdellovibrionales bacterium]
MKRNNLTRYSSHRHLPTPLELSEAVFKTVARDLVLLAMLLSKFWA